MTLMIGHGTNTPFTSLLSPLYLLLIIANFIFLRSILSLITQRRADTNDKVTHQILHLFCASLASFFFFYFLPFASFYFVFLCAMFLI